MIMKFKFFSFFICYFPNVLAQDFNFELSGDNVDLGVNELTIVAKASAGQPNIGSQNLYDWKWKVKLELGSGNWIFQADESSLDEKEKFIKRMIIAHRNRTSIYDLVNVLDDEYFQSKQESYQDPEFFEREQEMFQQIDDVRMLGVIKYGNFDVVLQQTKFSEQQQSISPGIMNLVLIEGSYKLSTSLRNESIWINLNFGSLRDQLDKHLEELIGI